MGMHSRGRNWVLTVSVAGVLAAAISSLAAPPQRAPAFDAAAFLAPVSLANQREGWERILQKLRNGEMPPKGEPRPQAEIDTLLKYVQGEFDKADRNAKPDPGRVTAHRLNR